jgi:acyl-CoA reductase-like NAD-dependent aldehyde dehydrogenase
MEPFDDFDDAIDLVNDSDFGLQAGVFTGNPRPRDARVGPPGNRRRHRRRRAELPRRQHALRRRQGSGLGREGVRSAIRDMTEPRLLVIREPQS